MDGNIFNVNTQDHPYLVKNKGWCSFKPELTKIRYGFEVKQLNKGDICYVLDKNDNMKEVKIENIKLTNRSEKTYNLSKMTKNQNYFANGILVHSELKK